MRRATIRDVARLADVSLSTVSAVINEQDIVSPDTKQRVLEAIKRLDYQPTLYASNLARRKTRVLGLIISNLSNPFFAEVAQGFERAAQSRGYQVSLTATNFSSAQLRVCVNQMLGMRVAGLAILTSEFDEEAMTIVKAGRTPSVFLDVGIPGPHTGNIRVDTKGGMFQAVSHLVELGHREILFVRNSQKSEGEPSMLSHRNRSDGFKSAMRKHRDSNLRFHVIDLPGPAALAGLNAIRQALSRYKFTAVVAITDLVAFGVYRGLNEAGLEVPRDVSVVGFDNTFICEFMNPPLTTINIPKASIGDLAVSMLIEEEQSLGKSGQEVVLSTELVERQSTIELLRPRSGTGGDVKDSRMEK